MDSSKRQITNTILSILVLLFLTLPFSTASGLLDEVGSINNHIQTAVNYLTSHFNPETGLIYESEDQGIHWLKRVEYPNYTWKYSQTYWLYSDNFFAANALQPWAPEIANRINETIKRYNPPASGKFEAIAGKPVGPDRMARDLIVNQSVRFVVLIRLHDGMIADPRYHFADAMIYDALSKYYTSQVFEAQAEVRQVASMWNGTCMVDYGVTQSELTPGNAPSDIGFCINFKLALLLYGSEVTRVNLPNFQQLTDWLWKMQNEDGGIRTLSTGQGEPIGSANAETTSLTLLIYNSALITRLQRGINLSELEEDQSILLGTLIALPVLFLYLSRRKR